jgi:hypothetical protein
VIKTSERNYDLHRQVTLGETDLSLIAYAGALYLEQESPVLAAALGQDMATIRSEGGVYLAEVDHGSVLLSDAWRQLGWPRPEEAFLMDDLGGYPRWFSPLESLVDQGPSEPIYRPWAFPPRHRREFTGTLRAG